MKANLINKTYNRVLQKTIYQIFGTCRYNKFIIITRSRTGSNLLVSLLDSHPNIEAQEERFNRLHGRKSIDIWRDIFCKKSKNIECVGFKIFYYHPLDSEEKIVWNIISNDKNIKIIHLTREDLLRTVISKKIAEKTDNWSQVKRNKVNDKLNKMVKFNKEEFFDEFESTRKWEESTNKLLKNKKVYNLTYEDLISDGAMMHKIQQFLGVRKLNLSSKLKRQNPESLKKLVVNYDEMFSEIRNSEWNYLLNP